MYGELWKLCAGPVVDVPQAEERVFYFPQGHMEQVSFRILRKSLNLINIWCRFLIDLDLFSAGSVNATGFECGETDETAIQSSS